MVELRVRNVGTLKKVFDVLKDFTFELCLQWSAAGVMIATADGTKATLALVHFDARVLREDYVFARRPNDIVLTGLNLTHFNRILKTLNNSDEVTLRILFATDGRAEGRREGEIPTAVQICARNADSYREHAVRLIIVPAIDIVPNAPVVCGVTRMHFAEFATVVKEIQSTGSTVCHIAIVDGSIAFTADGELTKAHIVLSDTAVRISKGKTKGEPSRYPIPFLFMFSKASRFSSTVVLNILAKGVLMLKCDIPDVGSFVYYITPLTAPTAPSAAESARR